MEKLTPEEADEDEAEEVTEENVEPSRVVERVEARTNNQGDIEMRIVNADPVYSWVDGSSLTALNTIFTTAATNNNDITVSTDVITAPNHVAGAVDSRPQA